MIPLLVTINRDKFRWEMVNIIHFFSIHCSHFSITKFAKSGKGNEFLTNLIRVEFLKHSNCLTPVKITTDSGKSVNF